MLAMQTVYSRHLRNAPYTAAAVVSIALCVHKFTHGVKPGMQFSLLVCVLYAANQTHGHTTLMYGISQLPESARLL